MEKSTTKTPGQKLLEEVEKEFVERVVDLGKGRGEVEANKTTDEGKDAEGRQLWSRKQNSNLRLR